jgi:Flp pilus assembly protein TadD
LSALRLDATDWAALTMLGNVYYSRGQLELAQSFHEQSIAVVESPYALTNLGGVLGKQGRIAEARELFQRALALDPQYEKARLGLSVCEAQQRGS